MWGYNKVKRETIGRIWENEGAVGFLHCVLVYDGWPGVGGITLYPYIYNIFFL